MIKSVINWVCIWTLGTSLCMDDVSATDIYRSVTPDGTFCYASQSLDSSYVLYLKGNSSPSTDTLPRGKRSAGRIAQQAAIEPLIQEFAKKHDVDVALVRAVIEVESGFNHEALSGKGAAGLMQLMPATAARYGARNRNDPAQNIEAGVRYLKDLLALYDGNVALALASYNAGEGSITRHGRRIPPYKETMLYVPAVLSRMQAAGISRGKP